MSATACALRRILKAGDEIDGPLIRPGFWLAQWSATADGKSVSLKASQFQRRESFCLSDEKLVAPA